MKNKGLVILGVVLGIIFFVVGYIYLTRGAGSLPAFFPGYSAGITLAHTKHGLAAFIAGLACFVYAWFQSGPKQE